MSPETSADEQVSDTKVASSTVRLWIVVAIFALFALVLTRGMLSSASGLNFWTLVSATLAWIAAIGLACRNDIGRRAGIVMLIFSLAWVGFALVAVALVALGVIEPGSVTRPDYANHVLIPVLFGAVVLHVWMIETLHSHGLIGLMRGRLG